MTKGIQANEPDASIIYGDIIDLPHHQSKKHPHMSLYDRAAQFAPFSALTGYGDMVNEEATSHNLSVEADYREEFFESE